MRRMPIPLLFCLALSLGVDAQEKPAPAPPVQSAVEAVAALSSVNPGLKATYSETTGFLVSVSGIATPPFGNDAKSAAAAFIASHPGLLPCPSASLVLSKVETAKDESIVTFSHYHKGIPVWGTSLTVILDKGNAVTKIESSLGSIPGDAATVPAIPSAQAISLVKGSFAGEEGSTAAVMLDGKESPSLAYLVGGPEPILAYVIPVKTPATPMTTLVFVDAMKGTIVWITPYGKY